jgi:regulator of sigma E protease
VLSGFLGYIVPFLVVLTVLVFVHELGHYLVARWNGVRVTVFSIGFGPELFGWTDRQATRWKVAAIPLGGYVKMFGDADAASTPATDLDRMAPEDRAVSFQHKRVGQRAAIVAAGPIANFLFAVAVLFALFLAGSHPFPRAIVGDVVPGGPAAEAGVLPGDRIEAVDGVAIDRFGELAMAVRDKGGRTVALDIDRDGAPVSLSVRPRLEMAEAADGRDVRVWRLGIGAESGPYGIVAAATTAVTETVDVMVMTVSAIGEMITGDRGTAEIGGPIRIAQISGDVAQAGLAPLLWLMVVLSINLGLINLLPIPILDGGHLLFYAAEAIRGRPLGERAQEYGFRLGLALVLSLMVFATWNDLEQTNVFAFFRGLVS